jgi:hypothetical protein
MNAPEVCISETEDDEMSAKFNKKMDNLNRTELYSAEVKEVK